MPGSILGAEDVAVNRTDTFLPSVLGGETGHKQMVKYVKFHVM